MSKRIRVAMIIQSYYPRIGGAERQLAALAPLLWEQGIDLQVLTRRYPTLAAFENVQGVPVYRLPIPGPKSLATPIFILTSLHLLKRLQPDIIHAHELLSPALTAVIAKRLFKTPIVAKVLRGGALGDLAKLERKPFGAQRIKTLRRYVNAFITISDEIDAELSAHHIAPAQRLLIPNGVDTEHYAPTSKAEKAQLRETLALPEGPLVLFMGRFAAEKRIQDLISIWPKILITHPNATLLLIGTGEEEPALQALAGKNVRFTGALDNVSPVLNAVDLFVLPSATEGLSNAMLEAMAAGLPVIATSVGGAPDVIQHGHNGWLIPPGDRPKLFLAVKTLLENKNQRSSLGHQARITMQKQYALPVTAQRLRSLYDQVIYQSAIEI